MKGKDDTKSSREKNSSSAAVLEVYAKKYSFFSNHINVEYKIRTPEIQLFKIVNTCKPRYRGITLKDEVFIINQNGFLYENNWGNWNELKSAIRDNAGNIQNLIATDFIPIDGSGMAFVENDILGRTILFYTKDLSINESGTYTYDANLSVYDNGDNVLTSVDYEFKIQYKQHLLKNDEVKVIE